MSFADLMEVTDEACQDHLGEPVVYSPTVGSPVTVQGIFDALYVLVDASNPGMSSHGPAVFLSLADLPSDPKDDEALVTIRGTVYRFHEAKRDPGTGVVTLLLHENS